MRDKLVWDMSVWDVSVRDVSVGDKSGYPKEVNYNDNIRRLLLSFPLGKEGHDLFLVLLLLLSASHAGVDHGPGKFSSLHHPHVLAESGQDVQESTPVTLVGNPLCILPCRQSIR